MMNRFTIIIPIFNENESIFKLLDEIFNEFKKITPEIIIIDDGSHLSLSQLLTFKNLVQYLKKGGRYFIEDLGGSPGYLVGENTYYKPELINGIFEPELKKTAKQYNLSVVEGKYHPVIIE